MMQRTLYLFLLLGSAVATLGITALPMLVVPQIETSAQTSVQMTTQNFAAQELYQIRLIRQHTDVLPKRLYNAGGD